MLKVSAGCSPPSTAIPILTIPQSLAIGATFRKTAVARNVRTGREPCNEPAASGGPPQSASEVSSRRKSPTDRLGSRFSLRADDLHRSGTLVHRFHHAQYFLAERDVSGAGA